VKAAVWLLCACALGAQTVTVTGNVTNAITHQPIEGVSVVLYGIGPSSGANSDVSGRFLIPTVKAGAYRLVPGRVGFEGAAKEIRIEAGADPPSFDLTMVPWPGLRGTVLDPERQPVARVRVRAINPSNAPGVVYEATTDATGRYALDSLSPGQYHLLATPPSAGNTVGPELAPTWFPSVTDQQDAGSFFLAPGNDLFGYDIILRAVPIFRVSGRVVDEREEPAAGATVETSMAEHKTTARDDGTFDLARVGQGEVALRAEWQRGDVKLRGFAKVAVVDHDIGNLAVQVGPPVEVQGEIELDGRQGHRCEGEAILAPVDGQGERAQTDFSEHGIRFERVYPGRYRLIVLPGWMSGCGYLESVWLGERDITLDGLEVVPGMMPFRVVLRTGGGRLRGMVEDGNGGLVVLVPLDEQLRFRPFIVVAFIEGRTFALDNIRPGDYYAFALKSSFNADEMRNPEYARAYLDGAATVRLERDSNAATTLHYVNVPFPP
jgi:hypothetical protein